MEKTRRVGEESEEKKLKRKKEGKKESESEQRCSGSSGVRSTEIVEEKEVKARGKGDRVELRTKERELIQEKQRTKGWWEIQKGWERDKDERDNQKRV